MRYEALPIILTMSPLLASVSTLARRAFFSSHILRACYTHKNVKFLLCQSLLINTVPIFFSTVVIFPATVVFVLIIIGIFIHEKLFRV
jgi:hypothetical protein